MTTHTTTLETVTSIKETRIASQNAKTTENSVTTQATVGILIVSWRVNIGNFVGNLGVIISTMALSFSALVT